MNTKPESRIVIMCSFPHVNHLQEDGLIPHAELAPVSTGMAKRLAHTHLSGIDFRYTAASSFTRALRTIDLIRPHSGIRQISELGYGNPNDWNDVLRFKLETPQECYKRFPGLLRARGILLWRFIVEVNKRLEPDHNALLVSHSPLIESGIASLMNVWPPTFCFAPGDIGVITFMAGTGPRVQYLPFV